MKRKSIAPEFIALRTGIKRALCEPAVRRALPHGIQQDIKAALDLDSRVWTGEHDKATQNAMKWAMAHL
jgi:hypothetical protein